MAEGVLGLGGGGAASLNQDVIDKLKAAERKARVEPLETSIEDITVEREKFAEISLKVSELLDSIKPFDLFVSGGTTAFDEKAATTSGDSAVFNAADVSKLNNGITTVDIKTLAQKDVYQSGKVLESAKDSLATAGLGTLTIEVGGVTHNFDTSTYASYDELATAINAEAGISASFDQVGTDGVSGEAEYRLVLKSEDSGVDNKLTITPGGASLALGLDDPLNHTLTAQDMTAEIDGVSYSVSSNKLTVDGLDITANKTGISTINISDDNSIITSQVQEFITKYNEFIDLVDGELGNADTPLEDKSALRSLISQVKDKLFGSYGDGDDKSVFNYGFELDKQGKLSLDTTKFNDTLENDTDALKDLFIGTAAKEGLGTQLKSLIDEMSFPGGILDSYSDGMDSREKTLNEEFKKAEDALNNKYQQLALQFGSYGSIIAGFEASFSGLKMMIQQSTASN